MATQSVKKILTDKGIPFTTIQHTPSYTAQETAQSAHVHGHQLVKSVIVKIDGTMVMAVMPAPFHISLDNLKDSLGASEVTLASESEFADMFPGCEVGAMPPFGNLFAMPVYLAQEFDDNRDVVFNAGKYTELIRTSYDDFLELIAPVRVLPGAVPPGITLPKISHRPGRVRT